MPTPPSPMTNSIDFNEAFTHLFDDPRYAGKTAMGAVLTMVPILNIAVTGYELRLMRNVASGNAATLPEWDDLGGLFKEGLSLALARFVLFLPVLVLILASGAAFFAGVLSAAEEFSVGDAGLIVLGALGSGVAALLGFLLGVLMPAVSANYARHGTFASCFDFGEILRFVRDNAGPYVLAWLAVTVAGWVFGLVVSVLATVPCVGWLVLWLLGGAGAFWFTTVVGHTTGQLMALDKARRPTPIDRAPASMA